MIKKIALSAALLFVIAGAVAWAVGYMGGRDDGDKLRVVASYYTLADFARQVGGDKVDVTSLTPPGTEPHDYELPARAFADAQQAAVFVYNGGQLEPWAEGFLQDYRQVAVRASDGVDVLTAPDEAQPGRDVRDPHFWLDPVLAVQIVDNIRDGLVRADPANTGFYVQNAQGYKAKLMELGDAYREGLEQCARRTVVSAHDAFSYVGKRYNLEVVSIAGLSPEEEPSATKLAQLSQLVKSQGITHVFFEKLVSTRLADTLAAETGAKTLVFDPFEGLSNEDQQQGKDYISVQRENLANLRAALACQ